MCGENVREELAPAGEAGAKDDPERLLVDGLRAADGVVKRVVLDVPSNRAQREEEVLCRHRHAVAPARFGPDAVRQRERILPLVKLTPDTSFGCGARSRPKL